MKKAPLTSLLHLDSKVPTVQMVKVAVGLEMLGLVVWTAWIIADTLNHLFAW